ncbi:MAG: peptidoglycan-binding protein [Firmicutes bacterium]|nr:peptidoglycan-binding protein [Bacillota bacterium]
MPTGRQRAQVTTAMEMLPIKGARVITRDQSGNVIADQLTNEDGMTEYIELSAPDQSLTYNPDTAERGYSLYNVCITAEGFEPVTVSGLEILAGEASYLPVHMHPGFSEDNDIMIHSRADVCHRDPATVTDTVTVVDDIDVIGIPAPAVLQPLQSGTISGPAVGVRQVIIPTYITVRLGAPTNNAARNVRVPFVDYIANVASSEIFATWPDASLRANIHAITSFALNRIFTEWYRSRGFNFDITNTTQFDQFFVYGRNVFENLRQIAAEVFNQYVHRIGFANPLFTTYRANACGPNCLSQWGTVTLAQRGYSALQILRSFYGADVNIGSADRIQDVTTTYPGSPMRLGDTSRYIQLMQTYLNRIRQNFPLIPRIAVENGVFGADTQAAVRQFQSTNGLAVDGVIGPATWNRITQIWVAVTRLADLNSEGVRVGIGPNPPNVVLRRNSSGNDVRQLQWLLNYIAQYYEVVPGDLVVDGRFGPMTENSVREFQRNFGLNPDGVVGPLTWNRLYSVFNGIQVSSPDPAPIPPGPTPPQPPTPPTPGLGPDRFLGTIRTVGGNLNFRSGPTINSPVIGVIPNGSTVQVTGESGGFYHIVFDGRLGWVSRDFVDITPRNGVVVTQGGSLNLRSGPTPTSPVIGAIPNGSTVLASDVTGNFFHVNWNGMDGYASRDFIRLN